MNTTNMPNRAPARKVVGATAGAGIGGVTANLIIWGLDDLVFDPLLLSFLGGYFTRRGTDELIAPAQNPQR
jgi:hypothetical protein